MLNKQIFIKAVPLYAILDNFGRNGELKFVALVGSSAGSTYNITSAIDLKLDSKGLVDFANLQKRLTMLAAVSSSAQLLGICGGKLADFHGVIQQFFQEQFSAEFYLKFTENIKDMQCFDSLTKDPIPTTIGPGEAEVIATSTLHNHADYSKEESELIQGSEEQLQLSLSQLEQLVKGILAKENTTAEFDRHLVYLANLVSGFKQESRVGNGELLSSQLSLLTNQITAINGLEGQLARRLFGHLANPYFGRAHREITLLREFLLT